MTRVLHVLDSQADFQTTRAVAQLVGGLGPDSESRALTLGPGGDFGSVPVAAFRLRRQTDACDLVHAWGLRALAAVAVAAFPNIVYSPTTFPTRRRVGWLRAVMGHRDVRVICATATARRAMVERGVPVDRCALIRPGVDFARVRTRRDLALRAALGFADDHQVMLAVGESTREAAHDLVTWAATVFNVVDHRTRVLAWGRGPGARWAARLGEKMDHPELVVLAERALGRAVEFEELLPAADVSIVSATGPVSTLPIAIAMASNVPIVAAVTPTVAELLEDRHTALMVPPHGPRAIASRVDQLRGDADLRRTLADRARTEAFQFFPLTRFLSEYREAYRQAAGGETITPAP